MHNKILNLIFFVNFNTNYYFIPHIVKNMDVFQMMVLFANFYYF